MPPAQRQPFLARLREKGEGLVIEAIELGGFLLILYFGHKLFHKLWGSDMLFDDIEFKSVFNLGDAALIVCFVVRACLRLFGKMKET